MVDRIKLAGRISARKIENAYAVLVMVCSGAAVVKLAAQPKVHSGLGELPVWQFIAGIIGAGLLYGLFKLIDKE